MSAATRGPATSFAHSRAAWSRLDWWRLEARAFERHSEVRRALTFYSPVGAWQDLGRPPERPFPPALGRALVTLHIACLVLPVLAAIVMLRWLGETAEPAPVGLAGALAGFACAWLTYGTARDLRDPAGPATSGAQLLALLHLVPSAVATALAAIAIDRGPVAGPYGCIGLIADVVLGAVSLWLYADAAGAAPRWTRLKQRRLDRSVAALSRDERDAITNDVHAALDDLAARGLVDADEATAARALPLGALGRTLAAREELTAVRDAR